MLHKNCCRTSMNICRMFVVRFSQSEYAGENGGRGGNGTHAHPSANGPSGPCDCCAECAADEEAAGEQSIHASPSFGPNHVDRAATQRLISNAALLSSMAAAASARKGGPTVGLESRAVRAASAKPAITTRCAHSVAGPVHPRSPARPATGAINTSPAPARANKAMPREPR